MLNKPWTELNTPVIENADVLLKAVPWDNAASAGKGAWQAPERIRQLSKILPPFTENGTELKDFHVFDAGDFQVDLDWERLWETIRTESGQLIGCGKFCLFLGGDHSVTIPLEQAFLDEYSGKKAGIIHLDSHSDILDEYCGHRWSHACTQRRALEHYAMSDEGLSLVGIRSWEKEELEYLAEHQKINIITAEDIWNKGISATAEDLVSRYEAYDAVYVSIDIDVLDPAYAPGTGTPEAGGLTSRELLQLIKSLLASLPVKVLDIVEVSPPMDSSDITSWAALKIIYEVFGAIYNNKNNIQLEGKQK